MKSWIPKAIEWKATPEDLRNPKTATDFCKVNGIPRSTFEFELSKTENQKKMLSLCLKNAKDYAPDVLENLGKNARESRNSRWTELYLKFILELAEKSQTELDVINRDYKIEIVEVDKKKKLK